MDSHFVSSILISMYTLASHKRNSERKKKTVQECPEEMLDLKCLILCVWLRCHGTSSQSARVKQTLLGQFGSVDTVLLLISFRLRQIFMAMELLCALTSASCQVNVLV